MIKKQQKTKKQHGLLHTILADFSGWHVLIVLLLGLVVGSSFAVIYSTHRTRQLVTELGQLDATRQDLDVEWRSLRLEQSAIGEHSRVEELARNKLGMLRVDPAKEVLVNK